jgi:hypothetical protein
LELFVSNPDKVPSEPANGEEFQTQTAGSVSTCHTDGEVLVTVRPAPIITTSSFIEGFDEEILRGANPGEVVNLKIRKSTP